MGRTKKQLKPNDPTKAVLYIRVSTEDQNLGPEAQLVAMERFCVARNLSIVSIHQDKGVSGATPISECEGLTAALESLKTHKAGILLAAKRDRYSRSVLKSAILEKTAEEAGAKILSCAGEGEGDDPASELMRTMVDAFAAYERSMIRQRTKSALAVKKSKGQKLGGLVPWGKTVQEGSKQLVTDPEEFQLLQKVKQLRQSGLKLREVAEQLNKEGVTLRGKPLYEVKIHRMLKAAA